MSTISKRSTLFAILMAALWFGALPAEATPIDPLQEGPDFIHHNDRDWAWASPCSGGCSALHTNFAYAKGIYNDDLNAALGVSRWRFVRSAAEWALRPDRQAFIDRGSCAAEHFDDRYGHCDYANPEVYEYDGGNNELWIVRDTTSSLTLAQSSRSPSVPAPGTWVLYLAGLAGIGFARRATPVRRQG